MSPENVNSEAIDFIKSIAPNITSDAQELSESYESVTDFIGCTRSEVVSKVNLYNTASKYLEGFASEYDKLNNIGVSKK